MSSGLEHEAIYVRCTRHFLCGMFVWIAVRSAWSYVICNLFLDKSIGKDFA